MKITDVQAIYLRLPEIQQRTDSSQDALLVKVSTDAGLVGWGEIDGCPLVAKAVIEAGYSHTQVNGLRAILLGEDPLDTARLFEPYRLFWIEEPLPPEDYSGYAKVSRGCLQHIAAGEQECSVVGFERLSDEGGIDIVQIDLTRCGFTQAMRIAAYAQRRGRKVCNHNFTTDINTAASLHFLCAIENALVMEYCVEPSEISQRLAKRPVVIRDGVAHLPQEPGLGVEPNPEIIEKYLVRA